MIGDIAAINRCIDLNGSWSYILIVAGVTSFYHPPPPSLPNFTVSSVCHTVLYVIDNIYMYRHLPGMFTGIPILSVKCIEFESESDINGRILTIHFIKTNIYLISIYDKLYLLKLTPCFYLALELSLTTCMQIRLF